MHELKLQATCFLVANISRYHNLSLPYRTATLVPKSLFNGFFHSSLSDLFHVRIIIINSLDVSTDGARPDSVDVTIIVRELHSIFSCRFNGCFYFYSTAASFFASKLILGHSSSSVLPFILSMITLNQPSEYFRRSISTFGPILSSPMVLLSPASVLFVIFRSSRVSKGCSCS